MSISEKFEGQVREEYYEVQVRRRRVEVKLASQVRRRSLDRMEEIDLSSKLGQSDDRNSLEDGSGRVGEQYRWKRLCYDVALKTGEIVVEGCANKHYC